MVGAPDGLGLFDNNDGTFTLLMNHELSSGSGAVRAHGANGAFISRYIIDKATLEVLSGSDLIQRVFAWNAPPRVQIRRAASLRSAGSAQAISPPSPPTPTTALAPTARIT